jgi:hypothetical protein
MVLTTMSAVLFLTVFLADLLGLHTNPYIGIVFFLVLPATFLIGLGLIPFGAWVEHRRRAAGKPPSEIQWPRLDLNDPAQRRRAVLVFALTMTNVVIVSLAAYRGIEYMDSVEFCGEVCHTVMRPEFTAYQDQAHSRVPCVACHVGSGATPFVQAKISGITRVFGVITGGYPRPIPSSQDRLRPARDTCERCHWPQQFHGDLVRRIAEYADDEPNTESVTVLTLRVGGGNGTRGIHWHADVANQVEYVATDGDRQVIPYVRLTDRSGSVTEYFAEGVTPADVTDGVRRRMDCMDCHNRPSHTMAASAGRAVNEAMARGRISAALPYVHREAVRVLAGSYPSQDAAAEAIGRSLGEFYRTGYGERLATRGREVEEAAAAVADIYRRSVFPEMNVGFGTYPNHIGHTDAPGCFRCHDDSHVSNDGQRIGQACETCHGIE